MNKLWHLEIAAQDLLGSFKNMLSNARFVVSGNITDINFITKTILVYTDIGNIKDELMIKIDNFDSLMDQRIIRLGLYIEADVKMIKGELKLYEIREPQ